MAGTRKPPEGVPPEAQSPEELERERAESQHDGEAPAQVSNKSPLDPVQIQALRDRLDPQRIKERAGRGGGKFHYLEGHDDIRTANRIFGFGNWGKTLVEQTEIGAVEVEREGRSGGTAQRGWHVGYRSVVRFTVRGCMPTDGSGYGDGVEYGPAARVTAQELALKESETDAMKRAMIAFGDQFGLILYAKGDAEAILERDQAADQARAVTSGPVTLAEVMSRLGAYTADPGPWIKEAIVRFFEEIAEMPPTWGEVPQTIRIQAMRRLQAVVVALEATNIDPYYDASVNRELMRAEFSRAFEGIKIDGPDPFTPPIPF